MALVLKRSLKPDDVVFATWVSTRVSLVELLENAGFPLTGLEPSDANDT
jgi:hypothetical protein